ncbi:MAG TPA: YibE/F family protein, partial [Patescibacteria group bacterium]|nr:YibE/F family protein [Patescibacteria group bacterium]
IMIGLLGVLYDVAIGQAVSVEELHHIAPHIPRRTIFRRAMRIGREHIGALVNTLAIAYVGASLPLLLLFSTPPVDAAQTVNKEIFSTEIIRTLIGSIGLVLAVPVTTFLSMFMLVNKKGGGAPSVEMGAEKKALEKYEHKHS